MADLKIKARAECSDKSADTEKNLIDKLKKDGFIKCIGKNGNIRYTEAFYNEMNRLMNAGRNSVEAYAELGFDPQVFGENRARQAGKNARNREQNSIRFKPCNGTVSLSQAQTEGLGSMPLEDQLNYYRSRVIYLESLVQYSQNQKVLCGGDVIRIKLDLNLKNREVMEMVEDCLKNKHEPSQYGLEQPLKLIDILTIFNIPESRWNSAMQRRQAQEAKQEKEAAEREKFAEKIFKIVRLYRCIPGKRTISKELYNRCGIKLSLKRVRKIMQEMNLTVSVPLHNPYKYEATHDHPQTAPANLVNQRFFVAPRRVILTDITYIDYQRPSGEEEFFYLCVFKDAYTAEILGWATSQRMDVCLIKEAYDKMMKLHGDELKKEPVVYVHSDQGSQYLSTSFRQLLSDDGFIQSCSRRGNSQDNAPCESFFQKMKSRLKDALYLCTSYESASEIVNRYMHRYNSEFIQMCLGWLSPKNFYKYTVTGIYPFRNYFGVVPELSTVTQIRRKQQMEKETRDLLRKQKREVKQGAGDDFVTDRNNPLNIVSRDIGLLSNLQNQFNIIGDGCEHVSQYLSGEYTNALEQVMRIDGLLRDAEKAQTCMKQLSPEELQELREPDSWSKKSWLKYAEGMSRLFDYKPLHIFRNRLGAELRRVGFLRICRRAFRWKHTPAGQEILNAARMEG